MVVFNGLWVLKVNFLFDLGSFDNLRSEWQIICFKIGDEISTSIKISFYLVEDIL